MNEITVSSGLIAIQTREALSPSMRSIIWEIGAMLDEMRLPFNCPDAVWVRIPTARLRGDEGKRDNTHLKTSLERLTGIYLSGEYRGDPWGAVILAEWRFEEGGAVARLLVPPAAISAIRAPDTFAKIEARAAHSLTGHGRQLYVILADKKNLRQSYWTFTVDEMRSLMGVSDKKAYEVYGQFKKRVLLPALEQVNDFGTVKVKMTQKRLGRSIQWLRFDWEWKDFREAENTASENDRHSKARGKMQADDDAPPLIDGGEMANPIRQKIVECLGGTDYRKFFVEADILKEDDRLVIKISPAMVQKVEQEFRGRLERYLSVAVEFTAR